MRGFLRMWAVVLAALVVFVGQTFAENGGTNISYVSGQIAVTGPPSATTLTNHGVVIGQATSAVVATTAGTSGQPLLSGGSGADPAFGALDVSTSAITGVQPIARGGTNSGTALAGSKCMRSSGGAIVEAAGDCAVGGTALLGFGSGSLIGVNATVYLGPGSGIDTTEGVVQTVAANAATFKNLNCVNNAVQGTGANHDIVITMMGGACGSQTAKAMTCTITGSATGNQTCTADTTNAVAITAGQCFDWKAVTQSAVANQANVNCTVERTA